MAVTTEANPVEELVGRLFMEGVGTMHVMSVYLGVKLGLFMLPLLRRGKEVNDNSSHRWTQAFSR